MNIRFALPALVMFAAVTQATAQEPQPRAEAGFVQSMTFTVEAVNQETREVTLRDSGGWLRTFHAGPRVQNLAQVRKGDNVAVSYMQAIAMELRKSEGGARAAMVEQAQGAPRGSKPSGVMSREITLVGTILGVDRATGMVAIQGPEGNVVNMAVRDRARLKSVQVGDQVEATYTEAVAVTVTAPAGR